MLSTKPAIVRSGQGGRVEVLLTDGQVARAFPVKRLLVEDEPVRGALGAKAGRKHIKREIPSGHGTSRSFAPVPRCGSWLRNPAVYSIDENAPEHGAAFLSGELGTVTGS